MESINDRISLILDELKITKTEFAKKLKVSQQYISKLTNTGTPSDMLIEDICEKFGIDEDWLRTGEGEMFEQLTEKEEIMRYAALLLKNSDSTVASAIQALIVTYGQLDEPNKAVLEKIALQYLDNFKKGQHAGPSSL